MGSVEQAFCRSWVMVAAALAPMLGTSCSGVPSVKLPALSEVLPAQSVGTNQESVTLSRPASAADLVDAQGVCATGAGVVATDGAPVAQPARGVGLAMTECEVVQILGVPQSTNISTTPRGEREVIMTFLTSNHAGLYRFVSGRLKSIERAPGAAEPEPAKKRPKRQSRKEEPA